VACTGQREGAYRVLVVKREGKKHLEDLGMDGMIILKWILNRMGVWTGLTWPMTGAVGGVL
jgi:hypothetical protein